MKSFNKFLGVLAIILFITMATSLFIAFSYAMSHPELLDSLQINITNDFNWGLSRAKSSDYDTIVESHDFNTLGSIEGIYIKTDIADIAFIMEDREDIYVEQYLEKPDTSAYKTTYDVSLDNNELKIISSQNTFNLLVDKDYTNKITIHVPLDAHFTTLDIETDLTDINDLSIINNVDNLYLNTDVGNIAINITSPKEIVKIASDIGTVAITGSSYINTLELSSNLDAISLDFNGSIDYLYINTDLGKVDSTITGDIKIATINTDIGDMNLEFDSDIGSLEIVTDQGNISLLISRSFNIYAHNDLNSITSDFPLMDKSSGNVISLESSLGAITIKAIE